MTTIQTSSHHFNPQLEGLGPAFVIRKSSVKHKTLFEKPSSPTLYPPLERAKNPSISNGTPQQTRKTLPNPVLKLELGKLSQTLKPEVKSSALKPVKEERSSPVTNSSPGKDPAEVFNKIDNFVIARLLEEAKERDSLATILKVENNPVLKMDNSMLPMEKEVQNKVFDKIQKTFQKKETNSPTFMPSVRQSNGNKQKQSETGSKAMSPRLMNGQMLATASSPLHKRGLLTNLNNYKKPLQFGFLSSRGDGRYGNESSFSPFKTSRGPNQLPETKSINSGYRIVNQANDKSGWNSERSPMSSRLLTQRGSEQQQPPFRGFIDEVKKSRIFKRIEGSLPVKISVESREKLHRIIHGDNFDGQDDDYHMTTQTSVVRSHDGRRLSNEEVIKNDLNAAIAEYENDFHARFNKTRRTRGQISDYQVKQKAEKVEKVDIKWAGEMPHRRAFAIANPADPNQEFLDPLHDRRRANFSKKTKPKQDDKVASTVDGKQKNNNKIDADLLADKYCGEKARFRRIRAALKDRLIKCADLKITIKDILKDKSIFPKNPYEKEGAELFIKAAKTGDYNYVYNILKTNRYFVNEFDPTKQTALHWAAKRGNKEVCRVLLDYCADPDAPNLGGRTPLYYALKGKHSEIVRLLLCAKANPWTFAKTNYKTVCRDTRSQIYITKARQISLLLKFQSPKDRQGVWEKEIRVGLAPIPSYDEDQS